MSEQAINAAKTATDDILEKEYHQIGISSILAAASCKKKKAEKKVASYRTLSEEIMTD